VFGPDQYSPNDSSSRQLIGHVPSSVHEVLRTPGEPLDPGVRGEAERRFGHDFGNVRVHSGPEASEAAAAVGAPAFTLGRHIVTQDGLSDPATPEGRTILSHELTHVVQQASFGDRDLGGAPVLDAAHRSEQEARAGTSAVTPLAGPAIQRAPKDLVTKSEQFLVDLTDSRWRSKLLFGGEETEIVYVLRDKGSGEALKVGKTTITEISGRFKDYTTAGNKWGRKLVVEGWTFAERAGGSTEDFEAGVRATLNDAGEKLPWDNTLRRLNRPGQGIPMPKEQSETEFIDEVEQLRVKHAPPNIPPRRGMNSKQKAKKAAAEKASAEEKATEDAGAKAEQGTKKAATEATPKVEQTAEKAGTKATSKVEQAAADTAAKATAEVEQAAEKAGSQVTSKLEQAATDTALKAGAEGALTRGLGATALEVVFNPALMFGWEVLKGISSDYQQAWDDIRRPARHIGFAQGWAARLAGLDLKWIKWNLAPQFVDRSDVATEVLGAAGMAEQAYIVGLGEGFRYGAGYSDALKAKKLGQAYDKIKARHEEVHFDTDIQLTRNSLILVAAMLQEEADRAIGRWDEQRKKAAEAADFKRRSENWTGHFQ
jgi:hypothetical protein